MPEKNLISSRTFFKTVKNAWIQGLIPTVGTPAGVHYIIAELVCSPAALEKSDCFFLRGLTKRSVYIMHFRVF